MRNEIADPFPYLNDSTVEVRNGWIISSNTLLGMFYLSRLGIKLIYVNKRGPLRWRHNGCDSVWNHQPHDCLLNCLFRRRSKKHQSSASLAFVWGIHRWPVNSPQKWPVTRKMFPFDDVIMPRDLLQYKQLVKKSIWYWNTAKLWWRHHMETLFALLALCDGDLPVTVHSPHKDQ